MHYYQLHLSNFAADPDLLSEQLLAWGALSVTLEDGANQPIFEPAPNTAPLWKNTRLIALFSQVKTRQSTLVQLKKAIPTLHYALQTIAEQNWQHTWMAQHQPLKFGLGTWVCPSWCTPPEPHAVNIVLDPGLAFGSGLHPTTALCLSWIDSAAMQNKIVVDYGCGSGILTIAALLHGAQHVYAIDYDPQALLSTLANVAHNGIDPKRLSILSPAAMVKPLTADVVIANILAAPLIRLAPTFFAYLRPLGKLVLAGILPAQQARVRRAYAATFINMTSLEKEGWVRLSAERT